MSGNPEIIHEPKKNRYVLNVHGREAGYATYRDADTDVRDFDYVVVDDAYRGRRLSIPLIQEALDDTREAGLKVRTSCSAVEHFLAKNEAYQDLVAGE
ncbi:GNAT family N-acetyltransferase [Corynebacterium pilosum]|uniref:Acetyltransferase n=1 Tax=Corynebacterium pilosum TaxID=35756 RepID=A0A376CM56_9CORY|nr:GNAT family N-acetyltransferase [Corynebacterium pilosum]STC68758.1 acetyltransferase [Corynebacterium pilosum]